MSIISGKFTKIGGGLIYIAIIDKDQNKNVTRMVFYNGKKVIGEHTVNARIMDVSAALVEPKVASADKNGTIVITDGDSVNFEFIDGPGTGKGKYGYLSRVKYIDSELFACGDLCQVYKRESGVWKRIDDEIRIEDKMAVGQAINDLDGFSQQEIYAVGDRGRVFCLAGNNWKVFDSITNVSLEKIKCSNDGFAYVVGDKGTLLRGRNDKWELWATLEDEGGNDRLWSVNIFQDEIYCCTAYDLYKVVDNTFIKIQIPIRREGSYLDLIRGMDSLWILASNQLLSFDGISWNSHSLAG